LTSCSLFAIFCFTAIEILVQRNLSIRNNRFTLETRYMYSGCTNTSFCHCKLVKGCEILGIRRHATLCFSTKELSR